MSQLKTDYMGIEIKNPILVGANKLTGDLDSIKKIEESGAGAIVLKSLFEEEIQLEILKLEEELEKYNYRHPEMITIFPKMEHSGPKEHLIWVQKVKKNVSIPVIASLNAVNHDTWIEYTKHLQETGVDGIELNFYAIPNNFESDGESIEKEQISLLKSIREIAEIPISVKLSFFYTNPLNFISRLDKVGCDGFVLFNRFFQPDIDVSKEENTFPLNLSRPEDNRLPLRFVGLLYGKTKADICGSTGIFEAQDVVKIILAGAKCVQVVSTLYKNKINHLTTILENMKSWMNKKGYASLNDFRGSMSQKNSTDPWVYTRAQYVKLLLNPRQLIDNYPVI